MAKLELGYEPSTAVIKEQSLQYPRVCNVYWAKSQLTMTSPKETATTSGTIRTGPLDLPEICGLIASFLDTRELASCSRVSRSWHTSFHPYLWLELDLTFLTSIDPQQLEDFRPLLQRNGHRVRHLRAEFADYAAAVAHLPLVHSSCRQLQELKITLSYDGTSGYVNNSVPLYQQCWKDLTTLIPQNPKLRVVVVRFLWRVHIPAGFWRVVASLPQIQTLEVHGVAINGRDPDVVDAFLDACLAVESLHLDYTSFNGPMQSERWANCVCLPKLTALSFFGRTSRDLEFFDKCLAAPGLKRVRWSTIHTDRYAPATMTPAVSRHIVNARLGSLTGLELWDGMPFTDEEICAVLDSLTSPLIDLSVPESGFGEMSLAALLRRPALQSTVQNTLAQGESAAATLDVRHGQRAPHCTTLQKLDLTGCPDVTDDMAERIRASCPHLKTLSLR